MSLTLDRIAQIEQTISTITSGQTPGSAAAQPSGASGEQFAAAMAQVGGASELSAAGQLLGATASPAGGLDVSSLLSALGVNPTLAAAATTVTGGAGAAGAVSPLESYTVTSDYGHRGAIPEAGVGAMFHAGIDLSAPQGSDIRAPFAGEITYSGWGHPARGNTGWVVEVTHLDGTQTMYNHMAAQSPLDVGTKVSAGDVIGAVGSTGNSSGPHAHVSAWVNGTHTDPTAYFAARGIDLK